MSTNMWFKNSNYLKKNFPEWLEVATSKEFNHSILQIFPANSPQCPIVQLNKTKCYLHSLFNIEREMKKMFQDAGGEEQILVIFGLGMGHCLDYIKKTKLKYKKILVFEPYNNIIQEMLKSKDFSELLLNMHDVSINIFKDPRQVAEALLFESLHNKNIKLIYSISYRSLFPDFFDEISRSFSSRVNSMRTSIVTMEKFLFLWTNNQIISLKQQNKNAFILNNKFKGIPAIVVSAGPSLEKQLEKLKHIGDKALIIAPGTGSRILNKRGIKAHLAMATDAQKVEVDIFKDFTMPSILVGSCRLDPEMYNIFPNEILRMILDDEFLVQYYFNCLDKEIGIIPDFSSVSSCAIDFLVKLGCNPIILIGQDMCYYDNKVHADEEKNTLNKQRKVQEAVDINGKKVLTDTAFRSMQHDMELLNYRYRGTATIINATEAGLGIPGVENQKFTDVISEYISKQTTSVQEIINNVLQQESEKDKTDILANNESFFQHVGEQINKIEELNSKRWNEIDKLYQMEEKGLKKNRLSGQAERIIQVKKALNENKFYKNVIMAGLHQILIYYNAGARYKSDGDLGDPQSILQYEAKEYEFTTKYIGFIKTLIESELKP
ncbi:MAG: 6-hydroxymethylpterin diphosphokinase MptE-like protein [Syntrophomonas sp.]